MIIEIEQGEQAEWCAIEFQGEILAEDGEQLDGYELGKCTIEGVSGHCIIDLHAQVKLRFNQTSTCRRIK